MEYPEDISNRHAIIHMHVSFLLSCSLSFLLLVQYLTILSIQTSCRDPSSFSLQFNSPIWLLCSTSLLNHCYITPLLALAVVKFRLQSTAIWTSIYDEVASLYTILLQSLWNSSSIYTSISLSLGNQHPDSFPHPPIDLRQPYKCS